MGKGRVESGWAAAAFSKAAVCCTGLRAPAILSGTSEWVTGRKTATPMVPPICRKKVVEDVATPMSREETALCMAGMIVRRFRSSPAPTRNIAMSMYSRVASADILHSISRPAASSTQPITGKSL
jgi:hypothetical protein